MHVTLYSLAEFIVGLLLCGMLSSYARSSSTHVSFICSVIIAGTFFFSRISQFFDPEMKLFGVLLLILVLSGAMAGGVVGVLLPKISLGITLGFSAAMYLCSILLAVRDAASVADFAIYTILFLVSLVISVPLAHKFPNECASVRTGLVVGFVFALSVDSLIPAHGLRGIFFAVLRMSIKETSLCVGPCLVPILLVLWTLVSLAYMGFSLYEKGILAKLWGTGGRGSYAVLGQSEGPSGGGIAAAPQQPSPHRQRTFSYPDTLVFNYFDPDSIPEPLVPYAESVFSVVQKLAQQHGFQVDNSRNQAEHLLMLLYNETGSADDVVSRPALRIHRRLFSNYRRWCRHMGVHSNLLKDSSKLNTFENLIEDILMFLLIWGEAANLKHMPECLCFLTHKMMEEHLEITGKHNNNTINSNNDSSNNNSNNNSNGSVTGGGPKRGRYPGFFLDMTVTPLFEVVNEALRASGDHRNHKTYDDFNEFFWTPDCLKYRLHDISDDGSSRSGRSNSSGSGGGSGGGEVDLLLSVALRGASKTYLEKRSWLHPLISMNRIFEWHTITFTLLAVWAYSNLLQWTYAFTLQVGSFIFWEITFFSILWTALEVWTLFPSVQISNPSKCGYLLRLLFGFLILTYQSIYYHWSFVSDESSVLDNVELFNDVRLSRHDDHQTFWWWQYIWLSLLSSTLYFLESLMSWCPFIVSSLMAWDNGIVQAFLTICYPISQLYVAKDMPIPQKQVFRYIVFWLTLLTFKLWFGYRYVVAPVTSPSLVLYDDYVNYYGGPEQFSFIKTSVMIFFWWFPHFLVYLIDLSIWYSVWASVVGGFIAIIDRQGAVRESPGFRAHFMRAPLAFCTKLMPSETALMDKGINHISTTSLTGILVPSSPSKPAGPPKALAAVSGNKGAKSSQNIQDMMRSSVASAAATSATTATAGGGGGGKDADMMDVLDVRSQRWMVFGRVWNEIITKMRETDHISNAERDMFLFTSFDWLTKPVYLPLFQTAGCVGVVVVALRDAATEYIREKESQQKMRIVEKFKTSIGITALEAVSEAWELIAWTLERLLGPTHQKDVERLVLVLSNWAESNVLFSRFSTDALEKIVTHIGNIVTAIKSGAGKRKKSPVVTPDFLIQQQQSQQYAKSEYTSELGGGRVKKSVSTGFLSALALNNDDSAETATAPVAAAADDGPQQARGGSRGGGSTAGTTTAGSAAAASRQFQKLQPFRKSQVLVDNMRDKVRDEVRNLFTVLRSSLKVKHGGGHVTAEGQDLIDRIVFILSLESGFIWNDIYASAQLDDLAADSRLPSAIAKLHGLLKLRVTQVELKSHEARRRLNFFLNSLFMDMRTVKSMRYSKEYTCITPYYSEDILLTKDTLEARNSDGVSTLLYLQTLYKDEFANFLDRRGIKDDQEVMSPKHLQELRMWASLRAQTLFRTVDGMMHTEAAVRVLAELEQLDDEDIDLFAKLKFNYVVACQVYGQMRKTNDSKADDIEFLLARHPNLRVAYIDSYRHAKGEMMYYSVLIKSNNPTNNSVKEVYRVKLPGNPVMGEGKPENQNHALIFTRGRYLQAIDMNQDGYFEEALKMRPLLEEFDAGHAIVGFREHIFTGSVSSVANYMALQELSFVTLGQRVLNQPLRIRQHYGHPDLFNKFFVMTEGGMSKASKGINLSEDVFAGYNATIRGHSVGFEEFVQVGKGRDVGLQQTYKFEAKLSQGNAEQSLSRDLSRICNRLDFFRLFSFYYGGIGHYIANTMVMFTLVVVVYTMVALAVFKEEGVNGRAMHPEGVLQMLMAGMGLLQTLPLVVTLTVEKGVVQAMSEIGFMVLSGGPLYFIFHIETKSYYFSQTLMAGGAMYRPTGRGFVTRHSPFDENFRFFASSHIYLGFELFVALILFGLYTSSTQYFGLTWSLWLASISFLLGPFWFNPMSFEWSRLSQDYIDWMAWMAEVGGGADQSWETWWKEENRFYGGLSDSWKIFLAIQRCVPWVLLAVGLAGHKFLHSSVEQGRVLVLLGVFAIFLFCNWVIHKLERYWTYAVRRFASLFLWTVTFVIVLALFISHAQYVQYSAAMYYCFSALSFLALLSGAKNQVIPVYKLHDYLVGHIMFFMLAILALLQMGYFQTWLLYHNALSSGVEIEDILKYARRSRERASDESDVVQELRSQVAEQQRLLQQLLQRGGGGTGTGTGTGGGGGGDGDTELTALLAKSPEPIRSSSARSPRASGGNPSSAAASRASAAAAGASPKVQKTTSSENSNYGAMASKGSHGSQSGNGSSQDGNRNSESSSGNTADGNAGSAAAAPATGNFVFAQPSHFPSRDRLHLG